VTAPPSLPGRMLRYGVAGVIATLIYFGAVVLFVEVLHLPPVLAAVLATAVVIVSSYVINRRFVFETDRPHTSAFARFMTASLVGIGLNAGLMHLATAVLHWPYIAGAALATAIVPPLNFVVNYLWTFRPAK
jgi:putative flippase GtrA